MKEGSLLNDARKVWSLLNSSFRWRLAWLVCGMFLIVGMEGLGIALLYAYLNLLGGDNSAISALPNWLADWAAPLSGVGRIKLIQWASVTLMAFFAFKNVMTGLFNHLQNRFIFHRLYDASANLFRDYIHGDFLSLSMRNSSEIIRNLTENTYNVYANVVLSTLNIAMESVTIAVLISAIVIVDPLGAVSAGCLMAILVAIYQVAMSHRFLAWGKALNIRAERMLRFIHEALGALKEIKILAREDFFEIRMRDNAQAIAHLRVVSALAGFLPRLYIETALVIVVLGLAVIMTNRAAEVETPLATLGLFGAVAFRMMPSANRLLSNLGVLRAGSASIEVLHRDRISLVPKSPCRVGAILDGFDTLILDDVSFTYAKGERPAIEEVSLTLRKGKSVAVVGRSGAGKTTLADVLLGLLPPQTGRILADGRDIDAQALGSRVAYVPQTPYFLDDSLRRNVAFGESDDTIDENRLDAAIQAAELGDLVTHLEQGLDTRLGENANRLSGGQRQRVALARAFYKDADLLVLDEATSALDMETEAEITRAVGNLARNRAMLVIAHRLSTIQHCDLIVLMDAGRVIASGNFGSLYDSSEEFRRLVKLGQLQTGQVAETIPL